MQDEVVLAHSQPQYRLRVGEVRVFYDVSSEIVQVVAIVTKAQAARWLEAHGRGIRLEDLPE